MKTLYFLLIIAIAGCSKPSTENNIPAATSDSLETNTEKSCSINQQNLVPITDLGTGYYRGYQGGLYPGGQNQRSGAHLSQTLSQAAQIQTLNSNGQPAANGKVVLIGVGASNPRTEFEAFKQQSQASGLLKSGTLIINTCIGGQGVQKMNQPSANYWQQADNTLQQAGLSTQQVQAAWVETEHTGNADTVFPRAPQQLMQDMRTLLVTMKQKFPNLKIVYLSGRAFSGYAQAAANEVGKGLLYPRDYYNGWAMKWMVEKQINNESGYTLSEIPFITMSTYLWSRGAQPRNDGYFLDCMLDVGADGLHLTAAGEQKTGQQLFQFFFSDPSTAGWIR
ncbi:MAG TPA: hypothetical protein PLO99_09370 [Chitinophagaceae bacterium]|nr:hypothetical protein [Chitinophagaceae bacterium]